MNLMQMIQLMKSGGNPQLFIMNMLEQQSGNNPMMKNLLGLAKQGKGADIEQIARNIVKEQGRDFDKEFAGFKQTLGL